MTAANFCNLVHPWEDKRGGKIYESHSGCKFFSSFMSILNPPDITYISEASNSFFLYSRQLHLYAVGESGCSRLAVEICVFCLNVNVSFIYIMILLKSESLHFSY